MCTLSDIQRHFSGRDVIVAGNGPSLQNLKNAQDKRVATVNAGLVYFKDIGIGVDLYWVQDRRVVIDKRDMVVPNIGITKYIAFNSEIEFFNTKNISKSCPIQMLGHTGFSMDPQIGVFHGFTAIYGLLQILHWCNVKSLEVYGVGLNYFSSDTRFYQKERSLDVDLNRASEQVIAMKNAMAIFRSSGIPVKVVGYSMAEHANIV